MPGCTQAVDHGDTFTIGASTNVECLHTPCHTAGHICFMVTQDEKEPALLFSGDTLFNGGCGRFFEGDGAQMYTSLVETLGALADDTLVYSGHEYTVGNLGFAAKVEPESKAVAESLAWAKSQREADKPTMPTTIAQEKAHNPFMRVVSSSAIHAALKTTQGETETEKEFGSRVMGALRTYKNTGV